MNLLRSFLPIIEVIEGGEVQKYAYTGEGKHINSRELDGLEMSGNK